MKLSLPRTGAIAIWDTTRRLLLRVTSLPLPHRTVFGLRMVSFADCPDDSALLEKLVAAVSLIRQYDPPRGRRLGGCLKTVMIVRQGAEFYDHGIRGYVASAELLRIRAVEAIALALVHESTHAWLRSKGIHTTSERLDRIERLCIGQEIALAKRLPDASPWVAFAEEKLRRPWWNPQEGQRRVEALLATLDIPQWLRSVLRFLRGKGQQ